MINKKMSIIQILEMDRNTAAIMMNYGMRCRGRPHAVMESLEDACAAHGTDADELVRQLNEYFEKKESK